MRAVAALLRKDLLILSRSRATVAILVVYPVAIAVLIGLAISRSPGKPKVAIVDLTPPGQSVQLGGRRIGVSEYVNELFREVDAVKVSTRAAAERKVTSGEVLAAVVIPADVVSRISSGLSQADVAVIYDGNALKQSLVRASINSALAEANLALSRQLRSIAVQDIALLLRGGTPSAIFSSSGKLVGLSEIPAQLSALAEAQTSAAAAAKLRRIAASTSFAARNLELSKAVLRTVSEPIAARSTILHGRRTPLDSYAVVVAVTISLMFVCVLLAAGGLALEREEHTLGRLARGSRMRLPGGWRRQGESRLRARGRGGSRRSASRGERARLDRDASALGGPQPVSALGGPQPVSALGGVAPRRPALVSIGELISEKVLLAAFCSFALALAMLAAIGAFVPISWGRAGLWVLALGVAALAFGALGVAIGALVREVRAASLLAFLISLPLAFLALVPAGALAGGIYDIVNAISFVFPYKSSLQALDAAVNRSSPSIWLPLVHLLVLCAAFAALARVGLERAR